MILWHKGTRWYDGRKDTMTQCHDGMMTQWHDVTMAQRYKSMMARWYNDNGMMAQWYKSMMAQWHNSTMVQNDRNVRHHNWGVPSVRNLCGGCWKEGYDKHA